MPLRSFVVREPVRVDYDVARREWAVDVGFVVVDRTRAPHAFRVFRVPRGFRTDLASIPRLLWPLVAPFELSVAAPVAHDWLYRHGGYAALDGEAFRYTRADADALFYDLARRERVPRWRAVAAYLAVRVFGRGSWGAYAPVPDTDLDVDADAAAAV